MKRLSMTLVPLMLLSTALAMGQSYECWREASESCGISKELIGLEVKQKQVEMSFYYPMCSGQGRVIYDEPRFEILKKSAGSLHLEGDVDCSWTEKDASGQEVRLPCSFKQNYRLTKADKEDIRTLVETSTSGDKKDYRCLPVE